MGQSGSRWIAEIGPRLDAVHPAAGEERDEHGVGECAVVGADEEPIFAAGGFALEISLGNVVRHRQPAVVEEALKRLALVDGVTDRGCDRRFVEDEVLLRIAPGEEVSDERARLVVADGFLLLAWRVRDGPLDAEERADVGERGLGALRIGFERLEKVAARVEPTTDLDDLTRRVEVVVHGVRVGDDVAAVAGEEPIDGGGIVLFRELEQHVLSGCDEHPEVAVLAALGSLHEHARGTLAFDHRFFGESGGRPRQYESPAKKIEDTRNALGSLATRREVDAARLGIVGVCAGAGYAAGAVRADARVRAFATVAGFFHDAAQQRAWMGEDEYARALREAEDARRRWETAAEEILIPAVGLEGPVAMPLAEAYEYYGTPRGAVPNYVNAFALMSRAETLPYDAQVAALHIRVPTLMVHSERALAPALARKFFTALAGPKHEHWLESKGQIDFYDDPALIDTASRLLAAHFNDHLARP